MPNVIQALTAVKRDLGAVSKDNQMNAGPAKYKYRSIDDVLNKLHSIQVEHGVIFVPKLREIRSDLWEKGDKVKYHTITVFDWTIYGPGGDCITAATVGEALGNDDKGSNKGGTGALKQLLTQVLAIPFETNDPDHESPRLEASTPTATKTSVKPAGASAASDKGSEVVESSKAAPTSGPVARTCETCTYAIGASDPIKRKAGKYHHKACLEGGTPATVTPAADDITSIIDQYEGN